MGHNSILCVVDTPADRSRRGRPVRANLLCRTRNTSCLHSCSVKSPIGGYSGFDDGRGSEGSDNDVEGQEIEDGADAKNPSAAASPPRIRKRPAAPNSRKNGGPRDFIEKDHPQRARNLLPCKVETGACLTWDQVARGEHSLQDGAVDLYEPHCTSCGSDTVPLVTGTPAVVHTLSGRVGVRTCNRRCSADACKKEVLFDGASVGLFGYSEMTVYKRTFLDVILFTIISTKSSISAASAVSAFHLHCTGASSDYDTAQARQDVSKAIDQHSRTLLVPADAFTCDRCYS